ncbi:MAG: class I SAM-dependent methyltransferase [Planctomycetota bacterium]
MPPAHLHAQPTTYVAAAPNDDHNNQRANHIAQQLDLPRCPHAKSPPPDAQLLLTVTHHRLELRVPASAPDVPQEVRGGHAVAPDFAQLDTTSSAGRSLKAPLFRALGLHKTTRDNRPAVLDCTAGLLEDAWLLAAAGCQVTALERHPLLHLLLRDALDRAAQAHPTPTTPTTRSIPTTAARITLHHADATTFLTSPIAHPPSHILIDPMFTLGRKTAERKPLKLLRLLAGPDADSSQLLQTALTATAESGARVVVKRSRKAPPLLPDPAPQHTVEGKGFRFDIYQQP